MHNNSRIYMEMEQGARIASTTLKNKNKDGRQTAGIKTYNSTEIKTEIQKIFLKYSTVLFPFNKTQKQTQLTDRERIRIVVIFG